MRPGLTVARIVPARMARPRRLGAGPQARGAMASGVTGAVVVATAAAMTRAGPPLRVAPTRSAMADVATSSATPVSRAAGTSKATGTTAAATPADVMTSGTARAGEAETATGSATAIRARTGAASAAAVTQSL